jgi:tRNA G18 (ribose-2'-O)-methylase SpoU
VPHLERIDDADDPRIESYRDVRERDLVGRRGLFVAEGEVVLRVLAQTSRHRVRSVLIADKRAEGLRPILDALPQETPVYVAAEPVLDAIAGFHLHRGILAIGERAPAVAPDVLLAGLPDEALVVAAVGISNHDNIGGIFRNAAAFAAEAVLLDAGCCDPLYRKAIRVSVGAALRMPFARLAAGEDLLGLLQRQGFQPVALSPSGDEPLARLRRPKRAALLLGAEGPGLPPALLARARTVGIPMADGFDSLNVATMSGIALHHLRFVAEPA